MLKIKFIIKARAVLTLLFTLLVVYIVLGTLFINYFTAGVLCLGIVLGYLPKQVIRYLPYSRKYAKNLIKTIPLLLLINVLLNSSKSSIIYLIVQSDLKSNIFENDNLLHGNHLAASLFSKFYYYSYKLTVNSKNKNELTIFEIEEELREFMPHKQHNTYIFNQEYNGCISLFKQYDNISSIQFLNDRNYYIVSTYKTLKCTNIEELKQLIISSKQEINQQLKEGYHDPNIRTLNVMTEPNKKTLIFTRKVESNNKGWGVKEVYISLFNLNPSFHEELNEIITQENFSKEKDVEVICLGICPKSVIELVDFPVGSFLKAKDSKDTTYGEPYDNRQTITWSVNNLERGVRFSYISPPFHNLRIFFEPFLKFDSLPQPLVFTFGIIIAWIFTARGKPLIYIKSVANAESKSMSEAKPSKKVEISGNNFGAVGSLTGDNSGTFTGNQNINQSQKKQTLTEAAAEIQQLLEQLSQAYPTTTTAEKMTVVMEAADRIENNPTLKSRVVGALKSGGTEAFKEAIDHPLVNILVATIEGWKDAD
ncbi:hypothetical protein BJP36_35640 [Moorena producens JHB]|uniref:Uncharacterized protein n=2 Tax=Moorena producens (strain JHB) TaxID=1454205 RepID=A0A9Q9UW20_MOOP1|nr:hypothetical protein [Moorena producens]WAN69426.1 hypothetical protein BJP36_35640 [Moorena producens JHB]